MGRPGVSQEEIFNAIETLVDLKIKLTVINIQTEFGKGSSSTINRHFRTWKEKQTQLLREGVQIPLTEGVNVKNKILSLENDLKLQQKQNQKSSGQLLACDLKIIQLEKIVKEGEQEQSKLNSKLQQVQFEEEKIKALYKALLLERKEVLDLLVQKNQVQANQFREDLKAINKESLSQVRQISTIGQEQWLEEKIKVKALQQEKNNLSLKIKELTKQLGKAQNLHLPIKKQLAAQEKLILNCLDPKKVEQFKARKKDNYEF